MLNEIVAEVLDRYLARLHAYCWMTNHIHLLIQVGDTPLGRLMLRIASRYARKLQARFKTTGHLFERRYHAILVDADNYLLELLRYIHLNPLQAGIVKSPVDYPWSSHHAYVGSRNEPWVTTQFALSMFHHDLQTAINAYQRFVLSTSTTALTSPLQQCNPNDPRILGSDTFVASLNNKAWQPKSQKTLDDILNEACAQYSVNRYALFSSNRQRHLTVARAWVAHQAITVNISSLAQVARLFNRGEASLRESVKRHFNYP
jgi:REP element-mobilizing transposase RayT